jgi:hypothetical protein
MTLIKKILNAVFKHVITPDYVGDLSRHRLHSTKYEDLCK